MITNVKVELTDEERRAIAQEVFGRKALLTRNEVNALVEGLFDNLKEVRHEQQRVCTTSRESDERPAPVRAADGTGPARPDDPAYMRGWNAVGNALARARR